MQPIRQVYEHAPDFIPVPAELRHRHVEIILWPLEPTHTEATPPQRPEFNIADVECIIIPSREERNVR